MHSSNSRAVVDSHDDVRLRSALNISWKPLPKARVALCALLVVLWATGPGAKFAQGQTPGLAAEEKLIKDFTDPLTTLPQISLKDAFTPANFGTHVQTNQVILKTNHPAGAAILTISSHPAGPPKLFAGDSSKCQRGYTH